ncbi:hypothetical protein B0H12DRAFT_376910 [Mycena haematopus]|nr:hypothetical protein B0H12DRAFT_376910 [Mycena haematopus]
MHFLTPDPSAKPRLVPFVDRSILQRLAGLETLPDPDERPYFASESSPRPPLVTRIPEPRKSLSPPHAQLLSDSDMYSPIFHRTAFCFPCASASKSQRPGSTSCKSCSSRRD